MKKTAILFADGYEEVEALTVVDLLRRAKIGCDIVALEEKNVPAVIFGKAIYEGKITLEELEKYVG